METKDARVTALKTRLSLPDDLTESTRIEQAFLDAARQVPPSPSPGYFPEIPFCRDFGSYLGDLLIKYRPQLKWEFSDPSHENDIYQWQPVVMTPLGFPIEPVALCLTFYSKAKYGAEVGAARLFERWIAARER